MLHRHDCLSSRELNGLKRSIHVPLALAINAQKAFSPVQLVCLHAKICRVLVACTKSSCCCCCRPFPLPINLERWKGMLQLVVGKSLSLLVRVRAKRRGPTQGMPVMAAAIVILTHAYLMLTLFCTFTHDPDCR